MNQRSYADNHSIVVISPQLVDNDTVETPWLDMGDHPRGFALAIVGATDITVDVSIQQATDSLGSDAKALTGASVTQLTAAGGDDTYVSIEFESVFLDRANGFQFASLLIDVGDGTTGAYVAGILMAPARHAPVTQLAAYAQQVVLAG